MSSTCPEKPPAELHPLAQSGWDLASDRSYTDVGTLSCDWFFIPQGERGRGRGPHPQVDGLGQRLGALPGCPYSWGLTLRGRWISQLHKECRDRRNGSQLGFRLFFTTLDRHGELVTANLSSRILPFLLPSPQPQAPTSVLQTSWSLWSPLVL